MLKRSLFSKGLSKEMLVVVEVDDDDEVNIVLDGRMVVVLLFSFRKIGEFKMDESISTL